MTTRAGGERSIFEIADELVANVGEGDFGEAFRSVRLTDVEDAEDPETPPTWIVIVAKGDDAARISEAYSDVQRSAA